MTLFLWIQDLLKISDSSSVDGERRRWWRRRQQQIVAAEWAGLSDGCEPVWGRGTELPLCVSPDSVAEWLGYVALMTKINYSHWKTFLPFFFSLTHSLALLHTSLLFFATGCSLNVCHTKGWWWSKGRGSLSVKIYQGGKKLPPQRSQVRHCVLWWNMASVGRFMHMYRAHFPLKLAEKDSWLNLDLPHNMFRASTLDIHYNWLVKPDLLCYAVTEWNLKIVQESS